VAGCETDCDEARDEQDETDSGRSTLAAISSDIESQQLNDHSAD